MEEARRGALFTNAVWLKNSFVFHRFIILKVTPAFGRYPSKTNDEKGILLLRPQEKKDPSSTPPTEPTGKEGVEVMGRKCYIFANSISVPPMDAGKRTIPPDEISCFCLPTCYFPKRCRQGGTNNLKTVLLTALIILFII